MVPRQQTTGPLPAAAAMQEHFDHFDEAQQGV
jgi:hypothetical protein